MSLGLLAKDSMQDLASLADPNSSSSVASTASSDKSNSQTKKLNPVAPPKPQTPSSSSSSSPPTGRYSGFSSAYHDQSYYADHAYYNTTPTYGSQELIQKPPNGFWQSLLPCLFPWTAEQHNDSRSNFQTQDSLDYSSVAAEEESDKRITRAHSTDNDDVSIGTTGSDAFGEKLSNKERQAVLARLGMAQPETPPTSKESTPISHDSSESSSGAKRRGLLSDLPHCDPLQPSESESKPLKGILKRAPLKQVEVEEDESNGNSNNPDRRISLSQGTRRSLFPQVSYEFSTEKKKSKKSVAFAPMARVVTVKSKNEMNSIEKGRIWWQKADYDDFRKTGRIITKAMMEGGTELWLNSTRASYKTNNGGETKTNQETGDMITATGDKWWHKFGHSRRGLEHVVSVEEGRQRQLNVRTAIRAVLDEQTRQQMYNRADTEKLRMVSLNYTSWARDLALASGSSDADAVKSSFSEERKSREFYLLKLARNMGKTASTARHVPQFMQPALGIEPAKVATPLKLDQHTNTQIRFRMQSQLVDRSKAAFNGVSKVVGNKSSKTPTSPTSTATCEPIHDHSSTVSDGTNSEEQKDEQSMAQRAAGFTAKNSEKVDMAAVLSGMGAVPQSSHVVSTA